MFAGHWDCARGKSLGIQEPTQQLPVKLRRLLYLRRVSQIRELDQRAIRNHRRRRGAQHAIIPNHRLHRRRRPRLPDGRVVLVADDQQRAHPRAQQAELVDDGLRVDHVGGLRLVVGELGAAGARVDVVEHADPHVVLGLPPADVVGRVLVGLDRGVRGRVLGGPAAVDALVGHAFGLPVFEAEGVHHCHGGCVAGIHAGGGQRTLMIHLGLLRLPGPTKTYRAYRAASIPPVLCPIIVAL